LSASPADLPIGVFDSGIGGLTVLRALRVALPHESFIYLGDTARLPYGTKSAETVRRYAGRAATHLVERGIKSLVVACNTATASALPQLVQAFAPLPVHGVIDPGAEAASLASTARVVAVLATEGTVRERAYHRALLRRGVRRVFARPAPLLVTLAEEGRAHGDLVRHVVSDYLDGISGGQPFDTLLLGCTHFPVFRAVCADLLGPGVHIVDSASTTAAAVAVCTPTSRSRRGEIRFLATDGRERFRRVGGFFLGETIGDVEIVDL
jgi:glutamate racemase